MLDPECIFCKIIKGEIPSRKVFETDNTYAFLDISPMSKGHTIVIPKNHYYNLIDIPENEIDTYYTDLRKTVIFMKDRLEFNGFNILQNNFPVAGQVVGHFHYHILPRYSDEKKILELKKNAEIATNDALDAVHQKLS